MEQGGAPGPPVRASDAERDAAVRALTDAAAEGRITLEELGERTGRALEAVSRDELAGVTADLPSQAPGPVRRGTRWVLGIMGGGDHAGRWRVAPRCTVVNVMGGASALERHRHEHAILVLHGRGQVLLGEAVHAVGEGDAVFVASEELHQLRALDHEPLGFLCTALVARGSAGH